MAKSVAYLVGERVRIRTEDKTVKVWGRVTHVEVANDPIGVPGEQVPGPMSVQMIIEVEGPYA